MKAICNLALVGLIFSVHLTEPKSLKKSMVTSTVLPLDVNGGTSSEADLNKELQSEIQEMRVETNVSNRYSKTLVTSKIQNTDTKPHEVTFTVIIPDKAFISGFIMEIDGKEYKAYVQEKEEAKQTYNNAILNGYAAGHVTVSARDSNRFTVSVNIQPQSKATFYLTYEELLDRKDEKYEVVLNVHPGQLVKNFTVQVNIMEIRPLKFVKVPGMRSENEVSKERHQKNLDCEDVTTTLNRTSAVVKFSPDVDKQKVLADNLGRNPNEGISGQFVVQYDVERDPDGGEVNSMFSKLIERLNMIVKQFKVLVDGGYFVHFFAPEDLKPMNKQVVFVLDISSSMLGNRITQLKEAMDSILYQLNSGDIFSIVTFNALVHVWNIPLSRATYSTKEELGGDYEATKEEEKLPGSFPATEINVENAKRVVKNLEAYGGTNIYSALKVAMEIVAMNENPQTHQPLIVFLTDGEPTIGLLNTKRIISKITALNFMKAPIFALSFGSGADRGFLQQLALKNQGFSRHIYEAADSYIQLENFYKQISSPLLSNVTFKYTDGITETTKSNFPLLFHGCEVSVSGKVVISDLKPKVKACGSNGTEMEFTPKVYLTTGNLERLWAYLTLRQLLEQRKVAVDKIGPTREALRLALKFSFVTDVSSLVVVQPNNTFFAMRLEDAYTSSDDDIEDTDFQFNYGTGYKQHLLAGSEVRKPDFLPIQDYLFEAIPSPTSPTIQDNYTETALKNITWLRKKLNKNATLTVDSKSYSLGLGQTFNAAPKCHNSVNNSTGKCTVLHKCPGIHLLLTNFGVFKKYFCIFERLYAGVCCPSTVIQ